MIVVIQNVGRVNVAALTEAIPSVATTITGLRVPMSPAQEEIRRPMSSVSSHSTEATESPTPGLPGGNNPSLTDTGTTAPILFYALSPHTHDRPSQSGCACAGSSGKTGRWPKHPSQSD